MTNYVPAVAVIRMRLVLFILNRFKGYVDGINVLLLGLIYTRVICREVVLKEWRDKIR